MSNMMTDECQACGAAPAEDGWLFHWDDCDYEYPTTADEPWVTWLVLFLYAAALILAAVVVAVVTMRWPT